MIDTLTTNSYLFKVNRDRELMTARMEGQRKAFWIICTITVCAVLIYLVLIYG